MKRCNQLPTVHEIIQQQNSMPSEPIVVPVSAATSPVPYIIPGESAHEHSIPKSPHERIAASVHFEFASSTNYVIKAAWQNALLQYFTNKLNRI